MSKCSTYFHCSWQPTLLSCHKTLAQSLAAIPKEVHKQKLPSITSKLNLQPLIVCSASLETSRKGRESTLASRIDRKRSPFAQSPATSQPDAVASKHRSLFSHASDDPVASFPLAAQRFCGSSVRVTGKDQSAAFYFTCWARARILQLSLYSNVRETSRRKEGTLSHE